MCCTAFSELGIVCFGFARAFQFLMLLKCTVEESTKPYAELGTELAYLTDKRPSTRLLFYPIIQVTRTYFFKNTCVSHIDICNLSNIQNVSASKQNLLWNNSVYVS